MCVFARILSGPGCEYENNSGEFWKSAILLCEVHNKYGLKLNIITKM